MTRIKTDYKLMASYPTGKTLLDHVPRIHQSHPSSPEDLVKWVMEAFYLFRYDDYDDESIVAFINIFAPAMGWTREQIKEAIDKVK